MNTEAEAPVAEFQLFQPEVIRQTERAVQIEVEIDTAAGRKGWKVWFPKSHARKAEDGSIFVTDWILNQKHEELREMFPAGTFYGITTH